MEQDYLNLKEQRQIRLEKNSERAQSRRAIETEELRQNRSVQWPTPTPSGSETGSSSIEKSNHPKASVGNLYWGTWCAASLWGSDSNSLILNLSLKTFWVHYVKWFCTEPS
ncbi:hypothetical protein I4U23_005748 [Adineta vaga]|nr:hypothetical protein I4U23_005748 [Adineta vaga]